MPSTVSEAFSFRRIVSETQFQNLSFSVHNTSFIIPVYSFNAELLWQPPNRRADLSSEAQRKKLGTHARVDRRAAEEQVLLVPFWYVEREQGPGRTNSSKIKLAKSQWLDLLADFYSC